jgi:YVTN family beta-propeller protein
VAIPVEVGPNGVTYDKAKGEIFVVTNSQTSETLGTVDIISDRSNSVTSTLTIGTLAGTLPQSIVYDSGHGEIFVTAHNQDTGNGSVRIINDTTNSMVAVIPVGSGTEGLGYDIGKGEIFVANPYSDNVSVINDTSNKVVATIPVGLQPWGVAYDSRKGEVFVTDEASSNVSVVNDTTNLVTATIPVGAYPNFAAYDSKKGEIFVTTQPGAPASSDNVSVISDATNTVVDTIDVVEYPYGLAYAGVDGDVFVASANCPSCNLEGIVSAINDTTDKVVAELRVDGSSPFIVAYDSGHDEVFVSNMASSTVSMIPLRFSATATANTTSGEAHLSVNFNASAFGGSWNYTSWIWSFGDGGTSALQNASHTYTTPGSYHVSVAVKDSAGAMVSNSSIWINVSKPAPFTVTLSPSKTSVDVGESTWINATVVGGTGPFTFLYSSPPASAGCVASGGPSMVCTPTQASQNFNVSGMVTDAYGVTANATSSNVTVSAVSTTLSVTLISADVGQPVVFNTATSGDASTLAYVYDITAAAGCAVSTGPSMKCIPTATGNFTVTVHVTDAYKNTWNATSLNVRVYPPLTASVTVSNATLWLGDSVLILGSASGGLAPYSYNFTDLPPGCVPQGTDQIGCLPTESGNYTIQFVTHDANNWSASATHPLSVTFDFIIIAPSSATAGQQVTIHVDSAPGVGKLSYNYTDLPPGCVSIDTSVLNCTPTAPGTYEIGIAVKDQIGHHASHAFSLDVLAATTPPKSGFLDIPGDVGYLLIAVIALAAVVVALIIYGRGPRTSIGAGQSSPDDVYAGYTTSPLRVDYTSVNGDKKSRENSPGTDPMGDLI